MAELTIQVQDVQDIPQAAVAVLGGAIDAKTVVSFQNQLNAVKERGVCRFILDMEHVKYVNSTGLGYLINLADSVQPMGGGIALVRVQPKVKVVFDMLGLNAFFHIYDSRKDAIEQFPVTPAGAEASVAGEESAPPVTTDVAEAPAEGAPAEDPVAPPSVAESSAPGAVVCAGCRTELTVRDPGTYRCPRCAMVFSVRPGGKPSFQPRAKLLQMQLRLNAAAECREGLGHCVDVLSRRAGFSEDMVNCIREAVGDTVDELTESSLGGDVSAVYQVLLLSTDSQIEIRISDSGRPLKAGAANARGQELFSLAHQVMDSFELKPHPGGGNLICMTKKASK